MPQIYAIGETVYDIIFKENVPVAARAGGSMLNTAVSLGRLGMPVNMITEYGTDPPGDYIDDFLKVNHVATSCTIRYTRGKTAVALAFLNEDNDARYSFYKIYPGKRLEVTIPDFQQDDILLFGAFYSLLPEVRPQVLDVVRKARDAGAFIVYDPNIRSPHKDQIGELRKDIFENISLADLVRGSDEDFATIFDIGNGAEAYQIVRTHGCDILLYTKSDSGVEVLLPGGMTEYPVPAVDTVSTIGAGDSFNAGLIAELFSLADRSPGEIANNLDRIIGTAIKFGSHVCTHYDNYVSVDFAEREGKEKGQR